MQKTAAQKLAIRPASAAGERGDGIGSEKNRGEGLNYFWKRPIKSMDGRDEERGHADDSVSRRGRGSPGLRRHPDRAYGSRPADEPDGITYLRLRSPGTKGHGNGTDGAHLPL